MVIFTKVRCTLQTGVDLQPTRAVRILSLSFGKDKPYETPGKKLSTDEVMAAPIIIDSDTGLGLFHVVTKASKKDVGAIGEIVIRVKPEMSDSYTSLLTPSTLVTSGLKGSIKLLAYEQELQYYLSFVEKTRMMLIDNWKDIKDQKPKIERIEKFFSQITSNLSGRKNELPLEISAFNPSTYDSLGRPNPTVASTKLRAISLRLEPHIYSTAQKADAMKKRRLFGQMLLECYGQYIWDMQYLKNYDYDLRGYSKVQEEQLLRRLELSKIKPFFFAGVYIKNRYEGKLGQDYVLPKVIEVYNAEMELCIVRDLLAKIAEGNEILASIRLIFSILTGEPEEEGYSLLYRTLLGMAEDILKYYKAKNFEELSKKVNLAKDKIRYRCNDYPDNPWYLEV